MADKLIKCKTCGKDVAQMAEKCPHCGAMTTGHAVMVSSIWIVLSVVVIGFILLLFKGCGC